MSQQQFHHRHQHHQQRNDQHQQHHRDRQWPGNHKEQRREFLWRERVKLEMQVQALIARAESLHQEWRMLQQRKAYVQQQRPKLAAQIMLSGLARMRSLSTERLFLYERERLRQEEERLRQAIISCQGDLTSLQSQIEVIQLELSFLK